MTRFLLLAAFLPAAAFAEAHSDPMTATVTPDRTLGTPTEWLGEDVHVVVVGTVNGFPFDMEATDLDALAGYEAKREYARDGEALRYTVFEFGLQFVDGGVEKTLELEFENQDFSTLALPADLSLAEEEFPEGPRSNMELEFEWEGEGTSVNEEVALWSGTMVLALDQNLTEIPSGEGLIGGFVEATKGADSVTISFTVPMTEYEIDD